MHNGARINLEFHLSLHSKALLVLIDNFCPFFVQKIVVFILFKVKTNRKTGFFEKKYGLKLVKQIRWLRFWDVFLLLGVIHQLRGPNFTKFSPPTPRVDNFGHLTWYLPIVVDVPTLYHVTKHSFIPPSPSLFSST
jgi:hypothetical protein